MIEYNNILLKTALTQYGIKEIPGSGNNPEVVKYFKLTGYNTLGDNIPWCSAFMNWVAIKSNMEFTGELTARSWLNVGKKIEHPLAGDVLVFWRESKDSWKGHVGFYINENETHYYVLSGNQGNQVNISIYPKYRLLDMRRLKPLETRVISSMQASLKSLSDVKFDEDGKIKAD